MSKTITFIHGWGCDHTIWTPLIERLSDFDCHALNLGFVGDNPVDTERPEAPSLYVTHSLGTMWALNHALASMNGLIAINGFSYFQGFTNARTLKTMALTLKRAPEMQMQSFWTAAGLPAHETLHQTALEDGLRWLAEWDYTKELSALSGPITAIGGSQDQILRADKWREHWGGHETHMIEGGGHALPLTQTSEIERIIREAAS